MQMSFKEFINKVLTGMSVGIVVALIPGALLGELAKALQWDLVVSLSTMSTRMAAIVMGLTIAMQFKLTPIQSATLAITTGIASGALQFADGALVLTGIGDVINAGLAAMIAVAMMLWVGGRFKAYTILLIPSLVIIGVGALGLWMLPAVSEITRYVGEMVDAFTDFTPVFAGILISLTFALMIVSPISTAAVAISISLSGVGSGAANLGICAAGFGLAIAGSRVNGLGTSIAHFLESPKMQMANLIKKPVMIVPILLNAAVCGAVAGILGIQGTPASAGFGISGLIGPINHLNSVGYDVKNILITGLVFIVIPVVGGYLTTYVCEKQLKIVQAEDYRIDFK